MTDERVKAQIREAVEALSTEQQALVREQGMEIERLLVELTHRVGWEERCLRAEADVLEGAEHDREIMNGQSAEIARLKVEVETLVMLQRNQAERIDYEVARAERLRAGWDEAQTYMALSLEREERLRAALTEMLESFTEPEDDNDILRRARAALGIAKDG